MNGAWSDWSAFGDCSQTCGRGTRSKTRTCSNPAPQNGGSDCPGEDNLSEDCTLVQNCPIDGSWTEFGAFGPCSVTCGDGIQVRSRTCTNPAPEHGGLPCVGDIQETQACSTGVACEGIGSMFEYAFRALSHS